MAHRRSSTRAGVAAVELAFVLPFLVFLFVIAADFSRVFYYDQILTKCARDGAAYAADATLAAQSPYSSLQQAALATAVNLNPQPTVTSSNGTDSSGNPYVKVTVAWQFKTVTAFPGIPNTVNLSQTVQMRVCQ
jgi:Flp pilus assembly protein TadG